MPLPLRAASQPRAVVADAVSVRLTGGGTAGAASAVAVARRSAAVAVLAASPLFMCPLPSGCRDDRDRPASCPCPGQCAHALVLADHAPCLLRDLHLQDRT